MWPRLWRRLCTRPSAGAVGRKALSAFSPPGFASSRQPQCPLSQPAKPQGPTWRGGGGFSTRHGVAKSKVSPSFINSLQGGAVMVRVEAAASDWYRELGWLSMVLKSSQGRLTAIMWLQLCGQFGRSVKRKEGSRWGKLTRNKQPSSGSLVCFYRELCLVKNVDCVKCWQILQMTAEYKQWILLSCVTSECSSLCLYRVCIACCDSEN